MFKKFDQDALFVCHLDPNQLLSSCSPHAIELEGLEWPSVHHYVVAMQFEDEAWREEIRAAEHPKIVRKLARKLFKKKSKNWKAERQIYMTRGMYTKCKAWPEVAEALMDSGEREIVDTTEYDYFWGIGRDTRGENRFGQVLTDIRKKLREERSIETTVRAE